MTETPESRAEPTTVTGEPRAVEKPRRYDDDRYGRPNRVSQVLAWVGIIAGVVFVVAVIFFSGFWIGRVSGHHYGWHRGYYNCGQMETLPDGNRPHDGTRRHDGTRPNLTDNHVADGTRRHDGTINNGPRGTRADGTRADGTRRDDAGRNDDNPDHGAPLAR